mgnify:CR=1 FL=1
MLFIDETKRSDLPDSEFGIPEDRKFPLDTAEHVHSAIKLFGHAEESKRKSLAKRIASKAKSYGIEIPETSQVYKYLHENSNMTADQVDAFYTELKKRLAEDDEVITESAILESSKNNYKKIYDITIKMFKDSGRLPNADNGELKQFLATGKTDEFGGALCIAGLGTGFEATCGKINKEIKPLGGRIYADNYGCAFLSIKEDAILTDEENNNDLDLPDGVQDDATSLVELLDSVDPKHIYLSSDWHISKNHYTHEKNAVNTSEIVSWCKEHIKDDDIFMYLGDMTYRWANDEDKENAKKIFKSLPGIKILIIGNHDEFSDGGNYEEYGFKYAVKELHYKNIIFSHRPIDMCDKPGYLNIHGHKHHKDTDYHSMDGSANVNVYPSFHNNKPITLDRAIKHKDYYMRNNKRSDWNGMGESSLLIEESIDMIDNLLNKEDTKVDEWAMASFNPVIGIQKPYVLKAVDNTGSCINSKLYALSPDVISDKYLVVDENSKLSIVDKSYFDNYCVEVYEYTGNELNVGKIKKAYDEGNIVAPNYIYETLSGKDLLSDDQIDFDENFTKVDLDLYKAKTESFQATLLSEWDQINDKLYSFPVLENTSIDLNTKCNDELKLMQDINGYYLENTLTHNRTKSVPTIDMITEVMINSTLQKYI